MCGDWTSTTYSFSVRFTGEVPGYFNLLLLALSYLCYLVALFFNAKLVLVNLYFVVFAPPLSCRETPL